MNSKPPSISKLNCLENSIIEKHAILKRLDSDCVDLDDLMKECEAAFELKNSILLTKFKLDRLFPGLQNNSNNDIVYSSPRKTGRYRKNQ